MHTARTTLSLPAWDAGPEFEVEMVVVFRVAPARAETRLEPAEPASVEDIAIRFFKAQGVAELACPAWMHELFAEDDSFRDWLLSEAKEQDAYAKDCAAEARADERRDAL